MQGVICELQLMSLEHLVMNEARVKSERTRRMNLESNVLRQQLRHVKKMTSYVFMITSTV
jgi:hypothetical protein